VTDDDAATEDLEITIIVIDVQHPPMIFEPSEDPEYSVDVDEGEDLAIVFIAEDLDNDPEELGWNIAPVDLPDGWEFNDIEDGSAEFFWTPGADDAGEYSPVFTVTDPEENTDEITVHITVNNVNQAPLFEEPSPEDEWTTDVDEGQELTFRVLARDPDGDAVQYAPPEGMGDLPNDPAFNDNGDGSFTFVWTPPIEVGHEEPVYDLRFVASDGDLQDALDVHITVNDINRAPEVIDPLNDVNMTEDDAPVAVGDLDDVFTDPDEDGIVEYTATAEGDPEGLTLTIDNENVLTIALAPNFNLPDGVDITVRASDGFLQGEDIFRLVVEPVNDAPGEFILLSPEDGYRVDREANQVTFEWEESANVDDDQITYSIFFHAAYGDIDTTDSQDGIELTEYAIDDLAQTLFDMGVYVTEGDISIEVQWSVVATDGELSTPSEDTLRIFVPIPVSAPDPGEVLPSEFSLSQNFPNPFNPATRMSFTVPSEADVRLSVWDMSGRRIANLIQGRMSPGHYEVEWNAIGVSAGVYIFTLDAAGNHIVTKGVLIR